MAKVNTKFILYSNSQKILAWSVHIFTSLGLVAAFMALIAAEKEEWRPCFLWLFLCLVIDGIDGSLARKFKVSQVLPKMDGKSIDYVVDFVAYLLVPAFFFYKAEMVSTVLMIPSLSIILISSALYYGKKEMVADGQYFVGFPVLWNVVVFFQFFIFQNNPMLNFASVLFFGALHFTPIRFAYPSRTKRFFKWHLISTVIGLLSALAILFYFPSTLVWAKIGTILGALYFAGFAIYDTAQSKTG